MNNSVNELIDKKEKVKRYFDVGLWNAARVRNAVLKGWISADEYGEITGEPFGEES